MHWVQGVFSKRFRKFMSKGVFFKSVRKYTEFQSTFWKCLESSCRKACAFENIWERAQNSKELPTNIAKVHIKRLAFEKTFGKYTAFKGTCQKEEQVRVKKRVLFKNF